jgi:hypothetical protein
MKLVRGVGWNIDCGARVHDGHLSTEGHFYLALKKDEGFFEVMTMRTGTAAGRDVHVDYAEAIVGVFAGDGDATFSRFKTPSTR